MTCVFTRRFTGRIGHGVRRSALWLCPPVLSQTICEADRSGDTLPAMMTRPTGSGLERPDRTDRIGPLGIPSPNCAAYHVGWAAEYCRAPPLLLGTDDACGRVWQPDGVGSP